mgnify:CR=1 FL=1
MKNLIALFCGGLFGIGLFISGMTNTTKVQGWLDIFGNWDPTLAFVLSGAIIPMAITWNITKRIKKPIFTEVPPISIPQIYFFIISPTLSYKYVLLLYSKLDVQLIHQSLHLHQENQVHQYMQNMSCHLW